MKNQKKISILGRVPGAEDRERFFSDELVASQPLVILFLLMSLLILSAARPRVKRFTDERLPRFFVKELRFPGSFLWYYLIVMIISFYSRTAEAGSLYTVLSFFLFVLQFFVASGIFFHGQ
ncbi:DUF2232 domain-containing protein [Peribacillus saganii]|uniref:DUF2232 domain-containing protein n=1 Tax=Peribacillus saganii TaxID=2303992 RepID=A0A372LKL6_9BACI|nr:DUF2232 domain-containing protein [Peribacillus saganii]RFU67273.1 DUF2232 domain-containing protein [Peribacillus saganii]